MRKYSTAIVDKVWVPPKNVKTASTKAAEELKIDMEMPEDLVFSDDYVYSTVRAISARVNMNMDGFMKEELLGTLPSWIDLPVTYKDLPPHNDKFGYRTFIGANNHVDHMNMPEIDHGDPHVNAKHTPRGKILWAWYEEDPLDEDVKLGSTPDPVTKLAGEDVWVKLLIANDRKKFPVLCRAIEDGIVTKVSMGAEVVGSSCSVCGKFAGAPFEYCDHVRYGRGQPFSAEKTSQFVQGGAIREKDPILAFENNHGLQFFEESWILDIQADPTAVIMDLIRAEPGTSMRTISSVKSSDKRDYNQIILDLINNESEMNEVDLKKVATILDKEAANPAVNVNIDNLETLVDKNREPLNDPLTFDMNVSEEMDYSTPPHMQPGEYQPDRPFPCSARYDAAKANPEYPLDIQIDVDVCQGCMYNKTEKIGTVDCTFDDVSNPGGGDPLEPGFTSPEDEQPDSGLKTDDGTNIYEFPGLQHPPGRLSEEDNRIAAFYKLKAMLDVGRGTWKVAEDIEFGGSGQYGENRDDSQVDQFNHVVSISIPSTQQSGEPVDPEGRAWVVDSIETVMAREFGGTRVRQGTGGFVEDDTKHVDDITIIESSTDDIEKAEEFIKDLAFAVEDAFNQYAVEFAIDNQKYYTRDVH